MYGSKTADAVRRFQLMHGFFCRWYLRTKTKEKLEVLIK
ncbi:peptidoglycan-binding protein [Bacillus sp. Ru63]